MSPKSSPAPAADDLSECFDPFPEPHTFPGGWDLSCLAAKPKRPASHPAWHTPFPQPRTIPEGWDVGDMLK